MTTTAITQSYPLWLIKYDEEKHDFVPVGMIVGWESLEDSTWDPIVAGTRGWRDCKCESTTIHHGDPVYDFTTTDPYAELDA